MRTDLQTRESEAWRQCARRGSAFEVHTPPVLIFGRRPAWLALEVVIWGAVALAFIGLAVRVYG